MGLWSFLNRPLFGTRILLSWNEPYWWGRRLRNEAIPRALFMAACAMTGAATMLLLDSTVFGWQVGFNAATILGVLFGWGLGTLPFSRVDDNMGQVQVREDLIRRERSLPSLVYLVWETHKWPYAAIQRCVLVPGHALGKRFSILAIATDQSVDLVAVPNRIDLEMLVRLLQEQGVNVSVGQSLPKKYTQAGFFKNRGLMLGFAGISLLGLLIGLERHLGQGGGQKPAPVADVPQRAPFEELEAIKRQLPRGPAAADRDQVQRPVPPPPPATKIPPPPQTRGFMSDHPDREGLRSTRRLSPPSPAGFAPPAPPGPP